MNLSFVKKINGSPVGILFIQVKTAKENETIETVLNYFHKDYKERYNITNLIHQSSKKLK